jgi:YD repeat-containing protein
MGTMLISYEPNSDVLTLTFNAAPVAQTQPQGTATVSFDALGQVVAVTIPSASTTLWEHGGQVQVLLPER